MNIVSFEGPLPVKLGMTQEELSLCLDVRPSASRPTKEGLTCGFHLGGGQFLKSGFIDGRLAEVTISPGPLPVVFSGVDLLVMGGEGRALAALLAGQPDPRESYGILVFEKLGISVAGLHDGDVDNKAVSVFVEGHWKDLAQLPYAKF